MNSQAIADRDAFRSSPLKRAMDQVDAENQATTVRLVTESLYQQRIRMRLAETGHVGKYEPRHIEAYMRLECGTLDGLSRERFNAEVEISRQCVDAGGVEDAEALAQSYGLGARR